MNRNGFVSQMTCSVKEKSEIQINYWADIFAQGIKTLTDHNQQVPDVLIAAASKWVRS